MLKTSVHDIFKASCSNKDRIAQITFLLLSITSGAPLLTETRIEPALLVKILYEQLKMTRSISREKWEDLHFHDFNSTS